MGAEQISGNRLEIRAKFRIFGGGAGIRPGGKGGRGRRSREGWARLIYRAFARLERRVLDRLCPDALRRARFGAARAA